MPTRVLGARRGVTKPKPWRITPRKVATEWRWAWGGLDVLGRWPLWEGGGTNTVDLVRGNTGVWQGTPTWTTTKLGTSAGINDTQGRWVQVDGFTPAITTDFAVETLWIHTNGVAGEPDDNSFLLSKWDDDATNKDFWCGIVIGDGGSMRWGTVGGNIKSNRTTWPAGQVFHTVINHFDSTRSQIWVNGELDIDASPGNSVSDTSDRLNFGSAHDADSTDDRPWPGQILLVAVYGRTLTGGEISRLATDPFAPFRPRRTAWVGGVEAAAAPTGVRSRGKITFSFG